ncbi:MAG: hypothetical protein O2955_02840 [Planctomycetota bacterium]|nr:hypothetical protein [Planctomycetota bacterium]MDA1211423.1 hypothetical protein [Planctomycetota bacterium]
MRTHENYQSVVDKANRCHQQNRNPGEISAQDITLGRLYSYAFRLHVIGVFHATRVALLSCPPTSAIAEILRQRTVETLEDLTGQSTEPIPEDFRVVVSTVHRYDRKIRRVIDSLSAEQRESNNTKLNRITERFIQIVEEITTSCGIHVMQDTHAPEQAGFVVPGLGITIVPLVYGDHHSWNLAWLAGEERNVPTHRHHHGVEIHLGYEPTHGVTVLGDYRAKVDEGYAMPIPPETDHGWVNTSETPHHVPFIFGSLAHAGWGVFLDVEASQQPVDHLTWVERESMRFSQMVYLEREIDNAARVASNMRKTLIPYSVTNRSGSGSGSGGLELSLTRINSYGYSYPVDDFRAVSISRGTATVSIDGIEREVHAHDHFGIPGRLAATLRQNGNSPLVVLDATIRTH